MEDIPQFIRKNFGDCLIHTTKWYELIFIWTNWIVCYWN